MVCIMNNVQIIGGNAKTLMFVNISPADYNTDETVVSLTYVELYHTEQFAAICPLTHHTSHDSAGITLHIASQYQLIAHPIMHHLTVWLTLYHSVSHYTTQQHSIYNRISQDITVYHSISQYITAYHRISKYITGYHRTAQSITEHLSKLHNSTVYHSISHNSTVHHSISTTPQ